jgi:hypothetical protein
MKTLLEQLSKEALALNLDFFTDEEKTTQWIGRNPATDEAIANAEKKLGIKLPNDVIELYKTSNGTSVILNQTFCAFMPIEQIDWLKNADAGLIEAYAGITDELTNGLTNSIIIAGIMYPHCVLIIPPYGEYKEWQYWEFANYVPGETPFRGIEKYLERLIDFLTEQNKNKNETLNKA